MELFAAAGIELPSQGKTQPRVKRTIAPSIRTPLLAPNAVEQALRRAAFAPSEQQRKVAKDYARKIKGLKSEREKTFRPVFIDEVLGTLLGYSRIDPDRPYTLADEHGLGRGAVDTALGHFDKASGRREVVAPFELKGPDTRDLDAIMSGRGKTPVQQAWEYANDAPGARWVLVSNCVEIRLYGYGRGRVAYETFDLTKLDQDEEHRRLWTILGVENFLSGATDRLLGESDTAYRKITDDLYAQYKALRTRLVEFLKDSADGPKMTWATAIEVAQKILDRVLFIAFAQRTDLMRDGQLLTASTWFSPYKPSPLWENYVGLFRCVDRGDGNLDIPAYNGGLFAPDPRIDAAAIPDPLAKDVAMLGEWDYRRDVSVTVLGHIFEQSITDLETMRAEARGEEPPETTKRKREGVVYTPDMITRFLVDQTLGRTLAERLSALRTQHGIVDGLIPADKEAAFCRDWLITLQGITVLDPACGSGAFLIAAFDRFGEEYRAVLRRLENLGESLDVDPFDAIVTKNLFGVDINTESVEITRLSLWLKTARRHHKLQNLEETIRVGDSIVSDKAVKRDAFDWSQFPSGGTFDVVIGNPPYVRMEHLKPIKPWLAENYVVAADRADLYAYFFERGVRQLKNDGRLGFISSSTFFRTGSGENLRKFLGDGVAIEAVVDFGDLQIFEGVTTYPAIIALRKRADVDGDLAWMKVEGTLPADLGPAFQTGARPMPRARLGVGSWRLEDDALARLRDKIAKGRPTLGEVYGSPLYGIKTGLNEAFVIDRATRDRLVQRDPKSAELLKPFLRGEDIKRWHVESEGLFLINTPKGLVDIDKYPAVRDWLKPFRKTLEKRATKQAWWELQQAQLAYQPKFVKPKIIFPDITDKAKFTVENAGYFVDCTVFVLDVDRPDLAACLNSKLCWFFWKSLTPELRGGFARLKAQFVSQTPIATGIIKKNGELQLQADTVKSSASKRVAVQHDIHARLLELAPPERRKLTGKLERFHELDFPALLAEVKKAFRVEIPLKSRGEWERYFNEGKATVHRLSADVAAAERDIDGLVYAAFDLTSNEIALLEASIAGKPYPTSPQRS